MNSVTESGVTRFHDRLGKRRVSVDRTLNFFVSSLPSRWRGPAPRISSVAPCPIMCAPRSSPCWFRQRISFTKPSVSPACLRLPARLEWKFTDLISNFLLLGCFLGEPDNWRPEGCNRYSPERCSLCEAHDLQEKAPRLRAVLRNWPHAPTRADR